MEERPRTAREWMLGVLPLGSHILNQGHSHSPLTSSMSGGVWGCPLRLELACQEGGLDNHKDTLAHCEHSPPHSLPMA